MTLVRFKFAVKDAAYITANASKVLGVDEPIFRNDGLVAYGDGVTPLSGLTFLPLFSGGGGQVDTVVGTANRISVDATDPANPIIDIDPDYDTAILNAIAAAVGAKKVYILWRHQYGGTGAVNPLDNNHYYFAHPNIAVTNTAGDTSTHLREAASPVTGTIIGAVINFYIGNAGSVTSEAGTLKFRNTTANTLTVLSSAVTWNTAVVDKAVVVTGLNLEVTQGNMCMSLLGTPTWATNPTGCYFSVDYIIELP